MNARANVLLVEDERIFALDLKQQLETLGYYVSAMVASGEQAVHQVEIGNPDLVLMDIHLEGMLDGIDAADYIQKNFRTPVIFLTAYAEDATIERAKSTSPFGYLVKPCTVRDLHGTLQMALARRAAEAARAQSEERLRLALSAAEMSVWEWDPATGRLMLDGDGVLDRGILYTQAAAGECFVADVHPEDREPLGRLLEAAKAAGHAVRRVYRRLNGRDHRYLEVQASVRYEHRTSAPRLIGVIRDITAIMTAEEQLRQAAAIYDGIAEGILVLDAAQQIISVNPAFTRMTGYIATDAVGRRLHELLQARRHDDQVAPPATSDTEGNWYGEAFCRHREGRVFPIWCSTAVVRDKQNAVSRYIVAFSDISAIRQTEEQLNFLAHHDPLTGLPNRVLLSDRLEQAIQHAARAKRIFGLIFLDLDGFKVINDTLGHSAGDIILKTVTTRIKSALRRGDTAARLGGDEFVVLLDSISHAEDAATIARKLQEAISENMDVGNETVTITASMGLSVYPTDGATIAGLLKAADTAMYTAKAIGRNRYCFYTEEMSERAKERLSIEQGIRRGLRQNEFKVYYQPQVEFATARVAAVEALVRWPQPQGGFISPAMFIPIAEENGLIDPIGRLVLEQACRDVAQWHRDGLPPTRLAVNVSARQLISRDFDRTVIGALQESGLAPYLLELEITESTLQALGQDFSQLRELRKLGVSIAIDDFGTGYSSLSMLRQLPLDRLKIDRSFVSDVPEDGNSVVIVQAILALARQLKLQVVAEGVENEMQRDFLRANLCDMAQGYLFSEPLPAEAMWRSLRTTF